MSINIGVIIIGSLYWQKRKDATDQKGILRDTWRKRLQLEDAVLVSAPIRYARFSESQGGYTMVFSRSAAEGSAVVVPYKKRVKTFQGLLDEAKELWHAEDPNATQGQICKNWGCVAMLFNPVSLRTQEYQEQWKAHVLPLNSYGKIPHSKHEASIVSRTGILQIPWPKVIHGEKAALESCDVLLAAANHPKRHDTGKPLPYPTPNEIARVRRKTLDANYFFANHFICGIRTFQDVEILRNFYSQRWTLEAE